MPVRILWGESVTAARTSLFRWSRPSGLMIFAACCLGAMSVGCAGQVERRSRAQLGAAAATFASTPPAAPDLALSTASPPLGDGPESPVAGVDGSSFERSAFDASAFDASAFDGTLAAYLAYAAKHSPQLRAAYEDWRAAVLRISQARRLPDPTFTYGAFLRRLETRVGPQRHRFGLSQVLPWPTKLTAGSQAAAQMALAAQRRFDAQWLALHRDVADAYWRLWHIDEEHRLKSAHDKVLEALAGTVRGRVETGRASLAELNQVDLGVARHHDHHGEHREQRRTVAAQLAATLGLAATEQALGLTATQAPQSGLPAASTLALQQAAHAHPLIAVASAGAQAAQARARAEAAQRWPSVRLGVEYMETGPAAMPNVAGSGRDPVMVGVAVRLPIWLGSINDAIDAALADAAAQRARAHGVRLRGDAAVHEALGATRDAQRRIDLYGGTLIPQAETTFRAVLGAYRTGRSSIAASLWAERDLLELQLSLARARADHARSWARLEAVVGRAVERTIEPTIEPTMERAAERDAERETEREAEQAAEGER